MKENLGQCPFANNKEDGMDSRMAAPLTKSLLLGNKMVEMRPGFLDADSIGNLPFRSGEIGRFTQQVPPKYHPHDLVNIISLKRL